MTSSPGFKPDVRGGEGPGPAGDGGGAPYTRAPNGWAASLELAFERRGGRTVLGRKRQRGPMAVQRPFYPESQVCHLYLLHPPGGVVGGDSLEVKAELAAAAHALITTPGAAKFYRSAGPRARQAQWLKVPRGGVLEWFPQENILFPGARLCARTQIELTGDGRFIGWEVHCFGRPAIAERFVHGEADLGLSVRQDGRPLLLDRLRLSTPEDLDGASGLRGHPVAGTFIASGSSAADLEAARLGLEVSPGLVFGMTLVDGLLVARCLSHALEPVRRTFLALWGILRPRLIGREACRPRIWAT